MQSTAHQVQCSLCVSRPQWRAEGPGGDAGALYWFFKSLHTAEGTLCSFHSQISELMRHNHGNNETHCVRVRVRYTMNRFAHLKRFAMLHESLLLMTLPVQPFILFKHIYWLWRMYYNRQFILHLIYYKILYKYVHMPAISTNLMCLLLKHFSANTNYSLTST